MLFRIKSNLAIPASVLLSATLAFPGYGAAQSRFFVGALGGIDALSADGKTVLRSPALSASSYRPENGPTVDILAGAHLNDYLSAQIDYLWNRNDAALTSLQPPTAFYLQDFSIRQYSALGSLLLYFRQRSSWVRPYLSVGTGVVRLIATPTGQSSTNGVAPPRHFDSVSVPLHVTVGIDLRMYHGWAFRYSFAETTGSNPISKQLSPPGDRMLASFRNLFGFVKSF